MKRVVLVGSKSVQRGHAGREGCFDRSGLKGLHLVQSGQLQRCQQVLPEEWSKEASVAFVEFALARVC